MHLIFELVQIPLNSNLNIFVERNQEPFETCTQNQLVQSRGHQERSVLLGAESFGQTNAYEEAGRKTHGQRDLERANTRRKSSVSKSFSASSCI